MVGDVAESSQRIEVSTTGKKGYGVAGFRPFGKEHVGYGVTDHHYLMGLEVELFAKSSKGLRVGLTSVMAVPTADKINIGAKSHELEKEVCRRSIVAGDDPHDPPLIFEARKEALLHRKIHSREFFGEDDFAISNALMVGADCLDCIDPPT